MLLSKLVVRFFRLPPSQTFNNQRPAISQTYRCVYMSNNLEVPAHYEGASERLSSILGCSKQESCAILMEFPEIKKLKADRLNNTCQYLTKELGLEPQLIISFPWLLQYSKKLLKERVTVLADKTKCAISSAIPLLQYDAEKLKKIFSYNYKEDESVLSQENQDRITYLCNKLKCSELETCDVISKHSFLLKVPLQRLEGVFEVFNEYKISPDDVRRDAWILRYKPEQIESRLEIVKAVGMNGAKPWLTRSTEKVFQRSLEKYQKTEELLGKSMSKLEFLRKVFQLESHEDAVEMARKYPVLIKMSPMKLKSGIDSLMNAGFSNEEIKAAPRALAYSSLMVIERQQLLKAKFGIEKPNLNVLVRSSEMFNKYVQTLEATA